MAETTHPTSTDGVLGLCTLCEQAPATMTWGFPVCQPCADHLTALDAALKAEEAADPDLAEKARRAEAAFERYPRRGGQPILKYAEVVRLRAALVEIRHKWPDSTAGQIADAALQAGADGDDE